VKNIRAILAQVKGIGAIFIGPNDLSTSLGYPGQMDHPETEKAAQQVLAACKEFNVACGYPATANDIEARMQQGFSVFVINWGDAGFKAVDIGRKAAGRADPGAGR